MRKKMIRYIMAAVLVLAAVTLTGCSQNAGPFMALLTNTGTSDDGADLAAEPEPDVFSQIGRAHV